MAKHAAACCVKEGLSYPIGDEEDSRGGRRQQAGDARQGLTMLQLCVDIVPRITHPASTDGLSTLTTGFVIFLSIG